MPVPCVGAHVVHPGSQWHATHRPWSTMLCNIFQRSSAVVVTFCRLISSSKLGGSRVVHIVPKPTDAPKTLHSLIHARPNLESCDTRNQAQIQQVIQRVMLRSDLTAPERFHHTPHRCSVAISLQSAHVCFNHGALAKAWCDSHSQEVCMMSSFFLVGFFDS